MVVALAVLSLAACGSHADEAVQPNHGVRPGFIAINEAMAKLFASCGLAPPVLVNIGMRENDGTGDLVTIALERIAGNMRIIEAAKCVKKDSSATPATVPHSYIATPNDAGISITGNAQCCDLSSGPCEQPKSCVYTVPHGKSGHGIKTNLLPPSHQ